MLNRDTAPANRSIWKGIGRKNFESHVSQLDTLHHVPTAWQPVENDWPSETGQYQLPFPVERQLADDLSFIATCESGEEYAAVAVVETLDNPTGLMIRLAANDGISLDVQEGFDSLLRILEQCASKEISRTACSEAALDIIIDLNQNKLFDRLESVHFQPPANMKRRQKAPLSSRWKKLMNTRKSPEAQRLSAEAEKFEAAFEALEEAPEEDILQELKKVVKEAFSTTIDGMSLTDRLKYARFPEAAFDKREVREMNKIANYWRVCRSLAELCRSYRTAFQNLHLDCLENYAPTKTLGRKDKRVVHAEIQIIAHYEITTPPLWPRAIGTSKEACFLCDVFIRAHGCFHVTKSRRRLYPQWTVPDRGDYSPSALKRIRTSLAEVDEVVRTELDEAQRLHKKKPHSLQSFVNLSRYTLPTPSVSTVPPPVASRVASRAPTITPRVYVSEDRSEASDHVRSDLITNLFSIAASRNHLNAPSPESKRKSTSTIPRNSVISASHHRRRPVSEIREVRSNAPSTAPRNSIISASHHRRRPVSEIREARSDAPSTAPRASVISSSRKRPVSEARSNAATSTAKPAKRKGITTNPNTVLSIEPDKTGSLRLGWLNLQIRLEDAFNATEIGEAASYYNSELNKQGFSNGTVFMETIENPPPNCIDLDALAPGTEIALEKQEHALGQALTFTIQKKAKQAIRVQCVWNN